MPGGAFGEQGASGYGDSVVSVVNLQDAKNAVQTVATTNTTPAALTAGASINGLTLAAGHRVLLTGETAGQNNGIYVVQAAGAAVRAGDFDEDAEVTNGAIIPVSAGTSVGFVYILTTADPITVGSTSLTFAQLIGASPTLASVLAAGNTSGASDLQLHATQKLILDGDGDDDTYIVEDAEDDVGVYIGGVKALRIRNDGTSNRFFFDTGVASRTMEYHGTGGHFLDFGTTVIIPDTVQASHLQPRSAATYDLGTAALEWRHLYQADSGVHYFGDDQDFTAVWDGTNMTFSAIALSTVSAASSFTRVNFSNAAQTYSGSATVTSHYEYGMEAAAIVNASAPITLAATLHLDEPSGSGTVTTALSLACDGGIALAATKKLYLDGGGDTYIHESSANTIDFAVQGVPMLRYGAGALIFSSGLPLFMSDNCQVMFGFNAGGPEARFKFSTSHTNDSFQLSILTRGDADNAGTFIICDDVNWSGNLAFAVQDNPTLVITSQTAWASATDEWVSITHDVTNAVIDWGSGVLDLSGGAGNVSLAIGQRLELDGAGGDTYLYAENTTEARLYAGSAVIFQAQSGAFILSLGAVFQDNRYCLFGENSGDIRAQIGWNTTQSTEVFVCAVTTPEDATGAGAFLLIDAANIAKSHDVAAQANPTFFVFSATDPDTANTQWVSITHDATDGVIDCGTGTLNLGATGNVNFAGATATAATVSHDAYVELEVAGVLKKFMLGS